MEWLECPQAVHTVQHEYLYLQPGSSPCPQGNCLKGCKWSPDGACLLTASEDSWLRIYDLPPDILTASGAPLHATRVALESADPQQRETCRPWDPSQPDTIGAALRIQEGECVYDYAWYARMSALDPQSCCLASTCRGFPIHLWDASNGELRATYRGYNDVDEVTSAFSLAFSPDGAQLYAGYSKRVLAFDITRPGREYVRRMETGSKVHAAHGARLPGMVSCMAFSSDGNSLAVGTYGNKIGVYDPRIPELQLILSGHKGGLTQVQFTPEGYFLLSGARQDPQLICWDLRGGSGGGGGGAQEEGSPYVVYRLERDTATTNQRIGFSLDPWGRYLATGQCDGSVKVFDLQTGLCHQEVAVASDSVTGCDLHPSLGLLAVATGHRRYDMDQDQGDGDTGAHRRQDQAAVAHCDTVEGVASAPGAATQQPPSAVACISNALRILRVGHVDGLESAGQGDIDTTCAGTAAGHGQHTLQ